ncbi:hypothetical protein ACTHTW_10850, partial [Neisseria sp. P0018.S006]
MSGVVGAGHRGLGEGWGVGIVGRGGGVWGVRGGGEVGVGVKGCWARKRGGRERGCVWVGWLCGGGVLGGRGGRVALGEAVFGGVWFVFCLGGGGGGGGGGCGGKPTRGGGGGGGWGGFFLP